MDIRKINWQLLQAQEKYKNILPGLFFSNSRNSASVIFGMFCNNGSIVMNFSNSDSLAFFSVNITFDGTVRISEPSLKSLVALRPSS